MIQIHGPLNEMPVVVNEAVRRTRKCEHHLTSRPGIRRICNLRCDTLWTTDLHITSSQLKGHKQIDTQFVPRLAMELNKHLLGGTSIAVVDLGSLSCRNALAVEGVRMILTNMR